jgi:quercetin dioxygenase-like cupin family protein
MEATFRESMRKVRAQLGPASLGVQTIDLPPDSTGHPWHDHAEDGQEEMYIALEGSGVLELESGEHFPLERDSRIRVGPGERRRVLAGPDGIRILVVGAIPGRAYKPWHRTVLGAPDPMAG